MGFGWAVLNRRYFLKRAMGSRSSCDFPDEVKEKRIVVASIRSIWRPAVAVAMAYTIAWTVRLTERLW